MNPKWYFRTVRRGLCPMFGCYAWRWMSCGPSFLLLTPPRQGLSTEDLSSPLNRRMPLQKVTIALSQNGWHLFIKLPPIRLKRHVYGHLMGLSQTEDKDVTLNRHLASIYRQLYTAWKGLENRIQPFNRIQHWKNITWMDFLYICIRHSRHLLKMHLLLSEYYCHYKQYT